MKLIYYHLYRGISKIDMDKFSEWKALFVFSTLLMFNFITTLNLFSAIFQTAVFKIITSNKIYLIIFYFMVLGVIYFSYGKMDGLKDILKQYASNQKLNTIWAKGATILYVILSFVLMFYSIKLKRL